MIRKKPQTYGYVAVSGSYSLHVSELTCISFRGIWPYIPHLNRRAHSSFRARVVYDCSKRLSETVTNLQAYIIRAAGSQLWHDSCIILVDCDTIAVGTHIGHNKVSILQGTLHECIQLFAG